MKKIAKGVVIALIFKAGLFFFPADGMAGKANVLDVGVERTDDGYLNVRATVQHNDEGWDHYADRWEILSMDGTLLDTRVLAHPHSPAPFTRSLPHAKVPEGTKQIRLRAHDSRHGYGGKEMVVELP